MKDLDLTQIRKVEFEGQYFKNEAVKTQIYLHETAGRPSATGTFEYWRSTSERVGTCIVIGRKGKSSKGIDLIDGEIVQGFSSKYWAYHLGIPGSLFKQFGLPYRQLNTTSIGIEICNWGPLVKTDRGYESWASVVVPDSEVVFIPQGHRGSQFFEKFTEAQIDSVRKLLVYWNKIWGIPIKYLGNEIFDIDPRALRGEPGVYTHNSVAYPSHRCDITPQKEMIEMLKSL